MSNDLTFAALRGANSARLPQFKNGRGGPAHRCADGSDWSPAQWFQAVVGELGEFAEARLLHEAGVTDRGEYRAEAAKELADVVTYIDILALRALDESPSPVQNFGVPRSAAHALMEMMMYVGRYANLRKKYERGDLEHHDYYGGALGALSSAVSALGRLLDDSRKTFPHPEDRVVRADPQGVDLGRAVISKFNEVSARVGSTVRLAGDASEEHAL
jgi:NTP pyrophosphatase (non-canonical NTP hydrolase)